MISPFEFDYLPMNLEEGKIDVPSAPITNLLAKIETHGVSNMESIIDNILYVIMKNFSVVVHKISNHLLETIDLSQSFGRYIFSPFHY